MDRKATMAEMARELRLSRMTVSSVVNGRYRERGICEATAARVREHLERRGFVPSRSARDLRAGGADALGILYSGRLYSHLVEALNELVGRANDAGRRLETVIVADGAVAGGLREMIARGVSRMVWLHRRAPELEFEDPQAILAHLGHLETVIYNYRFDDAHWNAVLEEYGVARVGVDREAGFRRLGARLRALGHTVVAVAHPEEDARSTRAGEGLAAAGLDVRFSRPAGQGWEATAEYAARLAKEIVRSMRGESVSAGVFLDDALAGLTMVELLARGVRIPADLTVTGFDGMPFAAYTPVPLTTLAVPVAAMVGRVEDIVADRISGKSHCFELELVERASHAPPSGGGAAGKGMSR